MLFLNYVISFYPKHLHLKYISKDRKIEFKEKMHVERFTTNLGRSHTNEK